jgi:DNA-binding PadR family transcriptional regulator
MEPIYGMWMLEELEHHGYNISPGTLYPVLHTMEKEGLLLREDRLVEGKIRKYYTATDLGEDVLKEARKKAYELFIGIKE